MIKVKDPLDNTIMLTLKCWRDHIVKEHPEMDHFFIQLRETVREPEYIYKSKISETSRLYFKSFLGSDYGYFYLMAVIDYNAHKKTGYIKTGFPVLNLKKGGVLVWKK